MIITAYCLLGRMSNMEPVHDHSAACPRAWKFGTKIEILDKEYVCHDHLAKKYDSRIDLWFPKCKDAKKFGIRKLKVTIK